MTHDTKRFAKKSSTGVFILSLQHRNLEQSMQQLAIRLESGCNIRTCPGWLSKTAHPDSLIV
jgi:hypothetical protein